MEKEHFERLEEDYIFLSKCLMKNTKLFIKYLTEEQKIMNDYQGEDILDEVSLFKRAQKMLDYVMERNDDEAYDALYKGCLHVHLWKAADILMPENAPHEPEEEEDYEEHLPESWPSESHFDMIKEPTKLLLKPSGPNMKTLYQQCTMEDSMMYNMNRKDKGRLLIIDNEKFDNMPDREGSHHDGKGLSYLFSNLGFEVRQDQNLTKAKMLKFMKFEAEEITGLTRCSCFILAIMSYGYDGNNGVFGTDGVFHDNNKEKCRNYITMKEIKEMFTLQALTKRPKVFLIVAQQAGIYKEAEHLAKRRDEASKHDPMFGKGGSLDSVSSMMNKTHDLLNIPRVSSTLVNMKLPTNEKDGPSESLMPPNLNFIGASPIAPGSKTGSDGIDDLLMFKTAADGPGDQVKIPKDADVFQAVVTPKEMLMHHDVPLGSWFIQAFIFVMANYAHQKDLREVFEKVNELIANQSSKRADSKEIEYCMANFTANKKLYFFPGIAAEE